MGLRSHSALRGESAKRAGWILESQVFFGEAHGLEGCIRRENPVNQERPLVAKTGPVRRAVWRVEQSGRCCGSQWRDGPLAEAIRSDAGDQCPGNPGGAETLLSEQGQALSL